MKTCSIPKVQLPKFEKLLSQLIATPSISSSSVEWDQGNMPVIRVLADWFEQLGFNVEIEAIPGKINKANLIATLGAGPNGLVLSGHTDTVPYDTKNWLSDPFKLIEREQKFYGLGTCDMKGFFPIIIEALRHMEGAELTQPLIILATADEESSMSGARALAQSGNIQGRAAVIGEPTSIKPIRMHKGILMESVVVSGSSGHSSNPGLGNSSLEGMYELLGELLAYRTQIQSQYQNNLFEVNVPTLNLGRIQGGDSPNRICGHCELSFDIRPLPGMSSETLKADVRLLAKKIATKRGLTIKVESLFGGVDPFETSAQAALVRICESLTGHAAGVVAFATEAPFLSAMGLETIVMGAGSIDQAHQPNEFLALDQIKPMSDVLRKLIKCYCVDPNEIGLKNE
ncbi:MAG: acetylornithine deacetylase [Oleiphilaceae bacterium]|jgi:acetylornithine deacetylase